MTVAPNGAEPPEPVAQAIEILEAAGMACIVAWRPAIGGTWRAAAANPLLREGEWDIDALVGMAIKVSGELFNGHCFLPATALTRR